VYGDFVLGLFSFLGRKNVGALANVKFLLGSVWFWKHPCSWSGKSRGLGLESGLKELIWPLSISTIDLLRFLLYRCDFLRAVVINKSSLQGCNCDSFFTVLLKQSINLSFNLEYLALYLWNYLLCFLSENVLSGMVVFLHLLIQRSTEKYLCWLLSIAPKRDCRLPNWQVFENC